VNPGSLSIASWHAADLPDVEVLPLEREGRRTSYDPQLSDVRQGVDDLLCDTVTQVLLVLLGAHVREGKHGNGRWAGRTAVRVRRGGRPAHALESDFQLLGVLEAIVGGPLQASSDECGQLRRNTL
jgi:hypothetical protein